MNRNLVVTALTLVTFSPTLWADTLVFHNGRRVNGELVGVNRDEIAFEERNGRRLRIARREIARIEFSRDEDGFLDDDRRDDDRRDDRAGGIPRGMRERLSNVTSREAWTDTGIEVRAGQAIYFSASGETRWGPNRRDGAAGERNSPLNNGRPLPDRPAAALIGRIGDGSDVFFIGADQGPFRARSSGRLFLGINDDFLADNNGSLRVTVSY